MKSNFPPLNDPPDMMCPILCPSGAAHGWWCVLAKYCAFALTIIFAAAAPAQAPAAQPATDHGPASVAAKQSVPQPDWPVGRFIVFSNMLSLPPIQVLPDDQEIRVGTEAKLRLGQFTNSPTAEAKQVAAELGVPVGLIMSVITNAAANRPLKAPEVAAQLRSAAVDYRFLLAEVTRYHPGASGKSAREEALQHLADGNLQPVWDFYRRLPWPKAPGGLGAVSQQ